MVWSGTTLTTPAVGDEITAAQAGVAAADLNTFSSGATWTATWGSSGTAPAIGNGTYTGFYVQAGKLLVGSSTMVLGSTSTVGTGNYTFLLPATANAVLPNNAPIGVLSYLDSSSGTVYSRILVVVSSTTCAAIDPSGVFLSATSPVVPANGDKYMLTLSYPTA